MTPQPLAISVVVPVYRAEQYLPQCVDSILGQTFKDFELILVDDGSPDSSGELCDNYATKDKRVTVIHQQNGGQTRARKAGVAQANGQFIMLVDADDWLAPNALQILYGAAERDHADIVTCDSYFHFKTYKIEAGQPLPGGVFDKKGLIEHVYPRMLYSGKFFYFGIYAAMWNKLFRADILRANLENVDNNVRVGEDGLTTYGAFLDANKVTIIHDKLYHYRNYNDSITRSYVSDQFDSTLLLIKSLYTLSEQKGVYDLSSQIDYYLLYNVRSIFEEEFQYKTGRSWRTKRAYLLRILRNPNVKRAARTVDISHMNRWSRVFITQLRSNRITWLLIITQLHVWNLRLRATLRHVLRLHKA